MNSKQFAIFCTQILATLAFLSTSVIAAPINYGDFNGTTVMYLDVTESSATDTVPLFGPPNINGDTLDFDPFEFSVVSTGGGVEIMDVQLNFDLVGAGGIDSLLIQEGGDFSLIGTGTSSTSVTAAVSVRIEIYEVDGAPITPIIVSANNSIARNLVSDGTVTLESWGNGVLVDFASLLIANNIDSQVGVTGAEIVINDQLIATSESGSGSFIAKKDFKIGVNPVPVPAAVWLFGSGLLGLVGIARRKKVA